MNRIVPKDESDWIEPRDKEEFALFVFFQVINKSASNVEEAVQDVLDNNLPQYAGDEMVEGMLECAQAIQRGSFILAQEVIMQWRGLSELVELAMDVYGEQIENWMGDENEPD